MTVLTIDILTSMRIIGWCSCHYWLVLVPGFEPGSTDRESVMMDRTTLHERLVRGLTLCI